MKYLFFLTVLFYSTIALYGQQQSPDKERMIEALKQSGYLRQQGNTLIYKVKKASDTAQAKLMYGALFNNTQYTVRFETEEKYPGAVKSNAVKGLPPNAIVTASNNAATSSTVACCCNNMKLFPVNAAVMVRNASAAFVDETWTVPEGITKIKIEAWSAGGDGWGEYADTDPAAGTSTFVLKGIGGGGGAYALITLPVTAGNILKMHIPFGGSNATLTLQLNDRTTGGLNLESGHNGREAPGIAALNGKGGKLGLYSGVFSGNVFSIAGADGEASFISMNYDNRTEHASNSPGAALLDYDRFNAFYGKGGDAPKGGSGGYGLKQRALMMIPSDENSFIEAGDGKIPGGGGGSAMDIYNVVKLKSGKGADGAVIIYY